MKADSSKIDYFSYLGQEVEVVIDRPLGSKHPKHDFIYPVNYGYLPNTRAEDGEEIDVYVLGEYEEILHVLGRCIAVVIRKNDTENKLVISTTKYSFSPSEIMQKVWFQERFFDSEIIMPPKP